MNNIIRTIKSLIFTKKYDSNPFTKFSFSQEGEDMILADLFLGKEKGFYVDIGAFHPIRFSNTNYFYQNGWSGINIEPSPLAYELFQKERSRDINLNLGISDESNQLNYYSFDEPALNTFDESRVTLLEKDTTYKCLKTEKISVERLDRVLEKYCPKNPIDFMSIDVEWHEYQVLNSNDWSKFRPKFLLVEILDFDIDTILDNLIHNFLKSKRYKFLCKTPRTCFYLDENTKL